MRTILKALGIGAALLATILAVGALLLWLLFDPNAYRDELEELVEARTGREFAIDDDLALTFFPWLGVETGRLRLGHAVDFGEDDFASVASVVLRVRLLSLFSGRLEIGTVVFDGLELNLARDTQGRENWADLLESAPAGDTGTPAGDTGTPAAEPEELFFNEFDVAGIDIRDGVVFWRENITEVRYVVSDLSLTTGPIVAGMPVDTTMSLQLVSVDPAATVQLDTRGSVSRDVSTQSYRADNLLLEFRLEDGQGDERASGRLETNLAFTGETRTVQLSEVAIESDLTDLPGGTGQLNVTAAAPSVTLDVAAATAQIPEAESTIGDMTARLQMTASQLLDEPQFAGTVTIAEAPMAQALELLGMEPAANLGDFDVVTSFRVEPLAGRAALTNLDGAALDMAVSGNIAVSDADVSVDMEAPTFDPGVVFSILPPAWTAGVNVTAMEQLTLSADFTVNRTNNGFSIREFAAALPGANVTGAMERLEDGDRLTGRLDISDLDPVVLEAVLPDLLPDEIDPEQLGTVRLSTAFEYGEADSELRLDDFAARVFGLDISGDLAILDPLDTPDVAGLIQVGRFSPRSLLERFGRDVPATADTEVLGEATLSAQLSAGGGRADLTALRMRLDDTIVTGRVSVEDLADPLYSFDLDLDRIDLDRYMPPQGEATGSGRIFDVDTVARVSLDGRISAEEMQVAGLSLESFSTNILVDEGVGRVEPLTTGLYGGEFSGAVELDARAGGPIVILQGTADAVAMEGLLAALTGEPALASGTAAFDVELTGLGVSVDEVLSSATGSIEFALRDGALQGFSLNHALCDVYNSLRGYPRPAAAAVDLTPYNQVSGTAQVREGIAQTGDVLAGTTTLEVGGGGRLDLVSHGIDFDLDAELTAGIPIAGCETLDGYVGESIPLKVTGTLADPQVLPDFDELLRRALSDAVEDVILDGLRDSLN